MATYEGDEAIAGYGDVDSEWAALDAAVGVVDSRWRRFFPAVGEERREFLHGQTSGHVESLVPGSGCPVLVLTAQGRPLGTLALYETGERIWVSTTALQEDATRKALSRFLVADDCDFEDAIAARCLTLVGPEAAALLHKIGVTATLDPWGACAATIADQSVMIFSRGDLRVPCYDVLACDEEGARSDADAVAQTIEAAGAVRCGIDALEILRVESGTARYGVDVDEQRIAVEARLEWAIHFAKGCYVGQEVIERAVTRGRVNHEMCLLQIDGSVAAGARVRGAGERDVVTSVASSPRLGTIALAYLPKASAEVGTLVELESSESNAAGATESRSAGATQNASAPEPAKATVLAWPRLRKLAGRS